MICSLCRIYCMEYILLSMPVLSLTYTYDIHVYTFDILNIYMVYTVNTQVYARYMHVYANFIQLTVYWFDWDSMLDEASINVDYERYWHTIRATPYLGQLERYCSIRCPELSLTILSS